MGELEQALSVYKSQSTGLSEDDFSQIKDILVQEAKDRKKAEKLMLEQRARDIAGREAAGQYLSGDSPIYFEGM
jgi:hypothetical protein